MQAFETLILFSLVLFFNALGSVMLKKGVSQRISKNSFSNGKKIPIFSVNYLSSKQVISGLLMQVVAFVGWLAFISHVALSFAFPLSSINNVTILIASKFMLHEHISPRQWVGVLFILCGIILISSK